MRRFILLLGMAGWMTFPAGAQAAERLAGEVVRENYDPRPDAQESANVRVARVTDASPLPGGPWAVGSTGDLILENEHLRVVVRGQGRTPAHGMGPERDVIEAPGAGCIADVAFRDTMWDSLGGVWQKVLVGGQEVDVVYTRVELAEPPAPNATPSVMAMGHAAGFSGLQINTQITLDPYQPHVFLKTTFVNTSDKVLTVDMLDEISWGAMPVFIGGFGFPSHSADVARPAHWVCGTRDDFSLGFFTRDRRPMDVVRTKGNQTLLRSGPSFSLAPGRSASQLRLLAASRGDMAPFEAYALKRKGFKHGRLKGAVQLEGDGTPVAGAEVRISCVNYENPLSAITQPYLITRTDANGVFDLDMPIGEFYVRVRTPGRPLKPDLPMLSFFIYEKEQTELKDILVPQEPHKVIFEVLDAESGESMPARVLFEPVAAVRGFSLGPPWKADGAELAFYLLPGPNEISVGKGDFKCHFSCGPEYEIATRRLDFPRKEPETVFRVALRRLAPADRMVAVDIDLPTEASAVSRVGARDLVRASAAQGLDWIVSGDVGRATDLQAAIADQGLGDWIRASAGVHLSYRHQDLFGDFFVFPVPAGVSAEKLDALAGPQTTPAEFFAAVRQAFPGAIVAVVEPEAPNAGYLRYYEVRPTDRRSTETALSPYGDLFSTDFDAIVVSGGKSPKKRSRAIGLMNRLLDAGCDLLPLASSRAADLYSLEPGHTRMYLLTASDRAGDLSEQDMVQAFRDKRYFITNGPMIEQTGIDEPQIVDAVKADQHTMAPYKIVFSEDTVIDLFAREFLMPPVFAPRESKFLHAVRVSAAPWVGVTSVSVIDSSKINKRWNRMQSRKDLYRYPSMPDAEPHRWLAYSVDPESKDVIFKDSYMYVMVGGTDLWPGARGLRRAGYRAFAMTPPILIDADGDGKQDYESWKAR